MSKKTVGEAALKLQTKKDEKINPIDMQRSVHKGKNNDDSWENQLKIAIKRGKKKYGNKRFFIVILFKKERLLHNVVRQYFLDRESCPTPEYDQCVYKFENDNLEYLWVVPDKETCSTLPFYAAEMPLEYRELIDCTIKFNSGELDKLAIKLNKEILKV